MPSLRVKNQSIQIPQRNASEIANNKVASQLEHEVKNLALIRAVSLFGYLIDCKSRKRYGQMVKKATSTVSEELDLVKFIRRQRFITMATLSQLNTR